MCFLGNCRFIEFDMFIHFDIIVTLRVTSIGDMAYPIWAEDSLSYYTFIWKWIHIEKKSYLK